MIKHLYTYSGNGTDPYRNLALEQYLTEHVADDACILYLWQNQNTVVIGRNQNAWQECRTGLLEQEGGTLARRLSGGGAVFHDMGNLNFTFSVSTENYDLPRQQRVILEACRLLGIQAELSGRNDLTIGGKKFSGNAQYVYKDRILHHGTLLFSLAMEDLSGALRVDERKIKSKGVRSVRSRVTNISEHLKKPITLPQYRDILCRAVLSGQGELFELTSNDRRAIQTLRDEKYATWEWNFGYSPKYTFTKSDYFPSGHVEVNLDVADGVIRAARVFGDFFSRRDVSELEQEFAGVRHTREAVEEVLAKINTEDYFSGIDKEALFHLFY